MLCFFLQAFNGNADALQILMNYMMNLDVLDDRGIFRYWSQLLYCILVFLDTTNRNLP